MMIDMLLPARRFLALMGAACSAVVMPVFADISLSGEQDGFLETGHYLVTGPITVKRGKTLSFAPGSIIRFQRFTGVVVEGSLKCVGTTGLPILFTSQNHRVSGQLSKDAPAPFDWNGILVADSLASLDFENVHVIYSTFGLDIKSSRSNIRLKDAAFDENGQFNLRVNGEQVDVKDNEPFSYVLPPWPEGGAVVAAPAVSEPMPLPVVRDSLPAIKPVRTGAWKTPMRIGFGAIALTGAVAAFVYDSEVAKNQRKYDELTGQADPAAFAAYLEKRDDAAIKRTISTIIAAVGACGFSITFLF
jgi:hypothetical protein